jgi:prophage regulatory protein
MRKKDKTPGSRAELCPVCGQMRMPNHAQAQLPPCGYVRQKWIVAYLRISKSKLWRDCKDGTFPAPYKIAQRVTGWRVSDIRQWMIDNGLMLAPETPQCPPTK